MRLKWYERLALLFCKEQHEKVDGWLYMTRVFKVWRGKKYILGILFGTPIHANCRCAPIELEPPK